MKASKKYAGPEYSGKLSPEFAKHRAKAQELRKDSKTYPGYAEGGTVQPSPSPSPAPTGADTGQGVGGNMTQSGADSAQSSMRSAFGYKGGGKVEGKAKVEGDSAKNDTVLAKLSPGEEVIKRSDMKSEKKAIAAVKKEFKK